MRPDDAVAAALAADRAHDDPAIWISRADPAPPSDGPFRGIPFAVKDNIDVAGLMTTAGCPGFSHRAAATAPTVQALVDAGAVLLGKTNLDQFATGLVGTRSPYGVPRNVFDAGRVPGGSSSGSAVAVAAGIVPFAIGTDTAGSGRVPAAFGNIVGLKPTRGSLSARGLVPACRSLDTLSIFTRSVDEALAVARIMAGFDRADPYARPAPHPHLRRAAAHPARVAIANVMGLCDPEVARLYVRAAALLGAEMADIGPALAVAGLLYEGPWVAERTAAHRRFLASDPEALHPVTRAIFEEGFRRTAVDAFAAFDAVAEARRHLEALFASFDALLLPTAPGCPTLAADADDPVGPNARLGVFTNFANLCDLAAFAVPAGIGADGLPVGVMLLGPAWSEGRLAPIADAVHRAFTDRVGATAIVLPPPAAVEGLAPDESALFCVGAHMAGLALNRQVTDRGGRFLRVGATAPAYRLHALGSRPGLVRGGTGAIAGEVWAVPTYAIGGLLALVPPPLGFGTVMLSDGPALGFLAEAAACEAAPDITALGGWRAWLSQQRP